MHEYIHIILEDSAIAPQCLQEHFCATTQIVHVYREYILRVSWQNRSEKDGAQVFKNAAL